MSETKHSGSCHCGAVRFEVQIDATHGSRCNCTVCTKLGMIGAIAKPHHLTVTGEESCSTYQWGFKTATRYFCKHCGVSCFARGHLAELGGDYVSVNLNALDDIDPQTVDVVYWDGRHNNWEAGPAKTPYPIHSDARSQTPGSTSPTVTS